MKERFVKNTYTKNVKEISGVVVKKQEVLIPL
jgi:hypothetical protein